MWKQCENTNSNKEEIGKNIKTGREGERLAAGYLKKRGYKILKTNISYPWGEIDIVAKDCENILIFIEVKTFDKRGHSFVQELELRPEDNMTRTKLSNLKKSCLFFANRNPLLANNGWRIDLISLTLLDNNCDIRHLKNIG
jgi:putative endonuclease